MKINFKSRHHRHLSKTITWRIIASGTTFTIAWLVTGSFGIGVAVGGIGAVIKMAFYYLHEEAWHHITA